MTTSSTLVFHTPDLSGSDGQPEIEKGDPYPGTPCSREHWCFYLHCVIPIVFLPTPGLPDPGSGPDGWRCIVTRTDDTDRVPRSGPPLKGERTLQHRGVTPVLRRGGVAGGGVGHGSRDETSGVRSVSGSDPRVSPLGVRETHRQ